jgi:hypothetical protein
MSGLGGQLGEGALPGACPVDVCELLLDAAAATEPRLLRPPQLLAGKIRRMTASAENPDLWVALVGLAGALFIAAILAIVENNRRDKARQYGPWWGIVAVVTPGVAAVIGVIALARRSAAPNWAVLALIVVVALGVESAALLFLSVGPTRDQPEGTQRGPDA